LDKEQIFAYITLFVLLAIRIPIADLVSNLAQLFGVSTFAARMDNLVLIQNWTHYFFDNMIINLLQSLT